jgi:hypothetical protein
MEGPGKEVSMMLQGQFNFTYTAMIMPGAGVEPA